MWLVLYSCHLPWDGLAIGQIGDLPSRKLPQTNNSFLPARAFILSCSWRVRAPGHIQIKKAGREMVGQTQQWGGTTDFCGTAFIWQRLWKPEAMCMKGSFGQENEDVLHVIYSVHAALGVQSGEPLTVAAPPQERASLVICVTSWRSSLQSTDYKQLQEMRLM